MPIGTRCHPQQGYSCTFGPDRNGAPGCRIAEMQPALTQTIYEDQDGQLHPAPPLTARVWLHIRAQTSILLGVELRQSYLTLALDSPEDQVARVHPAVHPELLLR